MASLTPDTSSAKSKRLGIGTGNDLKMGMLATVDRKALVVTIMTYGANIVSVLPKEIAP